MRRRVVTVAAVVLLCALSALPLAGATGDAGGPDEDTLVVTVDPDGADSVTRFFRVAETSNPYARARTLAASADVPVDDLSVRRVEARFTQYVDGRAVSGGELYRTTVETDLDRRTGPLGGTVSGETLRALAPADDPTVVVFVPPGVGVQSGESWSHSLRAEGYVLTADDLGDGPVTYRYGGGSLAVLAGVLVVPTLLSYWLVRRNVRAVAARDDTLANRVHAIRQTAGIATVVFPALALGAAVWFGAVSVVLLLVGWALPTPPGAVPATVTLWFVALTPFLCGPWLAAALAAKPTYHDLVGTAWTHKKLIAEWAEGAAVRVGWYWVGAVVLLTFAPTITDRPVVGAVLVTLLLAVRQATLPLVLWVRGRLEPVAGEQRADMADFCADQGVTPRRIYRLDTGTGTTVNGFALGVPAFAAVVLTDDLLDSCDSESVRAVLAHELGHLAHRHSLQRVALTLGFWYLAFLVYATVVTNPVTLAVAVWLYLQFGLGWLAQRQEYQADDYAAAATGSGRVADALERLASLNHLRRDTGALYNLSARHPSFDDRTARLREESTAGDTAE